MAKPYHFPRNPECLLWNVHCNWILEGVEKNQNTLLQILMDSSYIDSVVSLENHLHFSRICGVFLKKRVCSSIYCWDPFTGLKVATIVGVEGVLHWPIQYEPLGLVVPSGHFSCVPLFKYCSINSWGRAWFSGQAGYALVPSISSPGWTSFTV